MCSLNSNRSNSLPRVLSNISDGILQPVIRKKWKTLLEVEVMPLILQDNTACHKSQWVMPLIAYII